LRGIEDIKLDIGFGKEPDHSKTDTTLARACFSKTDSTTAGRIAGISTDGKSDRLASE